MNMHTAALVIGYVVMVAGGFAIAAAALAVAASAFGKYAWKLWDNLASVYKVSSMTYWFRRLSEEKGYVLKREFDNAKDRP